MIMTRTGETLTVKSDQGNVTVVLTDSTKTKDDTGVFGLGTNTMSSVVLIPGLKVDVDGTSDDQGRVVAKTITVDGDDLETSEMIQAGLHPTAQQVAANVEAVAANKQNISANKQAISLTSRTSTPTGSRSRPSRDRPQPTERSPRLTNKRLKRTSRASRRTQTGFPHWQIMT